MVVKVNDAAKAAIEEIIRKGNKAVVQRNGQDLIVMEERRKIEYRTNPMRD